MSPPCSGVMTRKVWGRAHGRHEPDNADLSEQRSTGQPVNQFGDRTKDSSAALVHRNNEFGSARTRSGQLEPRLVDLTRWARLAVLDDLAGSTDLKRVTLVAVTGHAAGHGWPGHATRLWPPCSVTSMSAATIPRP